MAAATEAGLDRLVFLLGTETAVAGIPPSKLIDHEYGARQEAFRRRVQGSLVTQPAGGDEQIALVHGRPPAARARLGPGPGGPIPLRHRAAANAPMQAAGLVVAP